MSAVSVAARIDYRGPVVTRNLRGWSWKAEADQAPRAQDPEVSRDAGFRVKAKGAPGNEDKAVTLLPTRVLVPQVTGAAQSREERTGGRISTEE